MVIKIPDDKTSVLKETLVTLLCKEKVTLRELQSLVGSLNFCAKAIPAARAFSRRFCDSMCSVTKPLHHIRLTAGMKSDIRVWLNFIEQFNGTLNFMELNWSSNEDLHLYTDSAGNKNLGCGVYLQGHWAYFGWPKKWQGSSLMTDITFLELVPIVLAMCLFKTQFCDKKILFHTDNQAQVEILNKKSSKSKQVMQLVRPLILVAMLNNIHFKVFHIEGYKNSIADSISRKQWEKLWTLVPEADVNPLTIPEDFLEIVSEMKLST